MAGCSEVEVRGVALLSVVGSGGKYVVGASRDVEEK